MCGRLALYRAFTMGILMNRSNDLGWTPVIMIVEWFPLLIVVCDALARLRFNGVGSTDIKCDSSGDARECRWMGMLP